MKPLGTETFGPMKLGVQAPFVGSYHGGWPPSWRESNGRRIHMDAWANWRRQNPGLRWPQLHERIGYRKYSAGPRPFKPGRYNTAAWAPHGYGHFSGLHEIMKGKYHSARYTGEDIRPEHYIRDRDPEEYERMMRRDYARRSWRCDLAA